MERVHTEALDKLYHAVLSLKTVEECYDFFEDLCTIKELKDGDRRQLRDDLPREKMPGLRQRRLPRCH